MEGAAMGEGMRVTVREDGAITLPVYVREQLGVSEGDTLTLMLCDSELLVARPDVFVAKALNGMGAALRDAGVDLDEWIESAREGRADLIRELYGIEIANGD